MGCPDRPNPKHPPRKAQTRASARPLNSPFRRDRLLCSTGENQHFPSSEQFLLVAIREAGPDTALAVRRQAGMRRSMSRPQRLRGSVRPGFRCPVITESRKALLPHWHSPETADRASQARAEPQASPTLRGPAASTRLQAVGAATGFHRSGSPNAAEENTGPGGSAPWLSVKRLARTSGDKTVTCDIRWVTASE